MLLHRYQKSLATVGLGVGSLVGNATTASAQKAVTAIDILLEPDATMIEHAQAAAAAFVTTPQDPDIIAPLIQYVAVFVPEHSGEHYSPHVTIGVGTIDYLNTMLAEPFDTFTFSTCWSVRLPPRQLRNRDEKAPYFRAEELIGRNAGKDRAQYAITNRHAGRALCATRYHRRRNRRVSRCAAGCALSHVHVLGRGSIGLPIR